MGQSMAQPDYTLRPATSGDLTALVTALACAIDWREQQVAASPEARVTETEHAYLLAGWGREGDTAVLAEDADDPIGAAWYRYWSDAQHSYGYVDPSTPELGIGVLPSHRGQGIGTALLEALLKEAERQGVRSMSLSVERDNPALGLYQRLGFEHRIEVHNAWTMLKHL